MALQNVSNKIQYIFTLESSRRRLYVFCLWPTKMSVLMLFFPYYLVTTSWAGRQNGDFIKSFPVLQKTIKYHFQVLLLLRYVRHHALGMSSKAGLPKWWLLISNKIQFIYTLESSRR